MHDLPFLFLIRKQETDDVPIVVNCDVVHINENNFYNILDNKI
jgi:hypothetical protein